MRLKFIERKWNTEEHHPWAFDGAGLARRGLPVPEPNPNALKKYQEWNQGQSWFWCAPLPDSSPFEKKGKPAAEVK